MSGGNFKVKATRNGRLCGRDILKEGQIYEYKNGKALFEGDFTSSIYSNFEDLLSQNPSYRDILVEVKETKEEESMKHKVGDKVIVKKGLVCGRNYDKTYFNSDMDRFAGRTLTISEVDTYNKRYEVQENDWNWSDEMFKDEDDLLVNTNVINNHPDSKIVITFNANETIAMCNNKQARALCNPTDAYDVLEGVRVAVSRVLNIPVDEKVVASKDKVRPIEDYSVKELLEVLEKRVK